MKLLIAALLGLVALAAAKRLQLGQNDFMTVADATDPTLAAAQLGQDDFMDVDDATDPNDLDQDLMDRLEKDAKFRAVKSGLLAQGQRRTFDVATIQREAKVSAAQIPQGYSKAGLEQRQQLVDAQSFTNVAQAGPVLVGPVESDVIRPVDRDVISPVDTRGLQLQRSKRQTSPTRLYYCPHRNVILHWFPLSWSEICIVPWAHSQAITFAKCTTPRCQLRWDKPWSPRGRCRPSCFTRRRILALCVNFRLGRPIWRWRRVTRNLPGACRCSTC